MKKLLILTLILSFTLLGAGSCLAAVHNFNGDFASFYLMNDFLSFSWFFDNWYSIDKDEPSATTRLTSNNNYTAFGAEYFQNDQTFVDLTYYKAESDYSSDDDPITYLKGSYLFANNFFIGLDTAENNDDSQVTFSPGYRFNLADKAGYIAASLDYAASDDAYNDTGIIDYEIYGRYYTDRSRFYGQLVIPNEDVAGDDHSFMLVGGAYRYNDNITFGANIWEGTDYYSYFDAGCTTTFDRLNVEFCVFACDYDADYESDYSDYKGVDLSILYACAPNFRAGGEYYKNDVNDDPAIYLKGKYTIDDQSSLMFMYRFDNDTYAGRSYLYWDITL